MAKTEWATATVLPTRSVSETRTADRSVSGVLTRDRTPFVWLAPARAGQSDELTTEARHALPILDQIVTEHVIARAVRDLVWFSIASPTNGQPIGWRNPADVSISVLNRRRRAARLWINSVIAGHTDRVTLLALTRTWMPQLAGTGHETAKSKAHAVRFVEWLRGAISAAIFAAPASNLVVQAMAQQALESVLAIQLRAIRDA